MSGPNGAYCRYYGLCVTSYLFGLSKNKFRKLKKKTGTDKLVKAEVSLTQPSNHGLFRGFSCSKSVTHVFLCNTELILFLSVNANLV